MEKLKKFSDRMNQLVSNTGAVLFAVLIVACVMQVFFRFVINKSLSWTEELARYCFIWMHMIGASLLIQSRGHATVTVILDSVHGTVRKALDTIIELVILFDGAVMIYTGFALAWFSKTNVSTAMSVPMWVVNSSVGVGGLLLVIQAVCGLAVICTEKGGKKA